MPVGEGLIRESVRILDKKQSLAFIVEKMKEWWLEEERDEKLPNDDELNEQAEAAILNSSMSLTYIPECVGNFMLIDDMTKDIKPRELLARNTYDIYHLLPLPDDDE